jgi:hypothetical protein
MTTTRTAIGTAYCAYCAMHNHSLCAGDCACGGRAHNPDVETAAAMRRYEAPDQRTLPTERLASDWHRKDER